MFEKLIKRINAAEFSKRLLAFIEALILLTYVLVIVSIIMGHVDALVAFITGVFSLATIAVGFYFWKAKCENINKNITKLPEDQVKKIAKLYDLFYKGGE